MFVKYNVLQTGLLFTDAMNILASSIIHDNIYMFYNQVRSTDSSNVLDFPFHLKSKFQKKKKKNQLQELFRHKTSNKNFSLNLKRTHKLIKKYLFEILCRMKQVFV